MKECIPPNELELVAVTSERLTSAVSNDVTVVHECSRLWHSAWGKLDHAMLVSFVELLEFTIVCAQTKNSDLFNFFTNGTFLSEHGLKCKLRVSLNSKLNFFIY